MWEFGDGYLRRRINSWKFVLYDFRWQNWENVELGI